MDNNDVTAPDSVKVEIRGQNNRIHIPASCKISGLVVMIHGSDSVVEVGENCVLTGLFKLRGNRCAIRLGEGTTIGRAVLFAQEDDRSVTLGEDCMLSHGIYANTSDTHSVVDRASGHRINRPGDIVIGAHVWLGMTSYIAKGVTIGGGSIVGAHAVVTRDVPPFVAVGGNPARILREGVSWDRRRLPFPDDASNLGDA